MTTTLSSLRSKLQTAIGDKNLVYADNYTNAIKGAIEEIFPKLYKPIDDMSLVTGNILPNCSFEDWTSTDYPDFYTRSSVTCAETTTAGLYRGQRGTSSAKATVTEDDGFLLISSDNYPRLLDLRDKAVTFKCWAYPEVANDAFIVLHATKTDGTTSYQDSTTTCPAGAWTLLEIEDWDVPEELENLEVRFRVHTGTKYAYYDSARAICSGLNIYEYLLPDDLQNGVLSEVYIQTSGYSDDVCDDLHPENWEYVYNWKIIDDGTYKYLRLPYLYSIERRIRLIGRCPLKELSIDTDTINLDGQKVNLLIAYAAYLLFEMEEGVPSSEDIKRLATSAARWWAKYKSELAHHRMSQSRTLNIG